MTLDELINELQKIRETTGGNISIQMRNSAGDLSDVEIAYCETVCGERTVRIDA